MKISHKFRPGSKEDGRIWFMSDIHYGHFNAIRHGGRPFETLEEMNQEIEKELKEKLSPEDTLFDLGDMFWKKDRDGVRDFLTHLIPSKFYKIIGNHDAESLWLKDPHISPVPKAVGDIFDLHLISSSGKDWILTLSHYPFLSWNRRYHGSVNLHGHCHGGVDEINNSSYELRVDLGWDGELAREQGSFLIPWETIEKKLENILTIRPINKSLLDDGHTDKT